MANARTNIIPFYDRVSKTRARDRGRDEPSQTEIVYRLYGLTEEEISVVEASAKGD